MEIEEAKRTVEAMDSANAPLSDILLAQILEELVEIKTALRWSK